MEMRYDTMNTCCEIVRKNIFETNLKNLFLLKLFEKKSFFEVNLFSPCDLKCYTFWLEKQQAGLKGLVMEF